YIADPLCVCLQALLLLVGGGEGIFQSRVFLPQHDGKQCQQQRSEDRRQAPPRPPRAEQPLGLTLRRTFILRDSGHQTCARAPLRIRVLIVPSGSPVLAAISVCVSPWKNAISSAERCSGDICCIAARARSTICLREASSASGASKEITTSSKSVCGRRLRSRSI